MPPTDIDRNLLFGVLALQRDMIDQARFAEACAVWALAIGRPLAEVLTDRGWITGEDRRDLERDVERKLKKHRGDVRATLGAVAGAEARDAIRAVNHPEVRKSLSSLPPAAGYVMVETLAPPPGRQEGSRYTMTRLHAEGGLGKVWVARDGDLNREVALKEIKPEQAAHPEMWRRFLKEAQITGQLEHPNIVPVYELARRKEDDQPFYTMRLVRGQTMRQAVSAYHARRAEGRADPLELHRLLQAFVSVCQAIAYAHSRGVVHRDLKPENVVLGGFGEVIVLDWGLAKMVDRPEDEPGAEAEPGVTVTEEAGAEATRAGRQLGTPAYMAPEQAEGKLDLIDSRTDVYGLGAILFEVLTGRPPHDGEDTNRLIEQIIHGETPRARKVEPSAPKALEAVCLKAMARARVGRYPSAAALADDVQRWLADEPISAYREPARRRLARWARRHRAEAITGGVALLLLAAAGGVTWSVEAKRQRQVRAHRDQFRLAARVDQSIALNEIRADRFATAEMVLDQALGRLKGETDPALVAVRGRLEGMLAEVHHVVEFYRIADEAERLETSNFDDEAEAACQAALRHVNLGAHPDWWEHLPAADLLDARQTTRFREEVYRQLLLLGGIRAKGGALSFGSPAAAEAYRRCLDVLPAALRYRPDDRSGRVLETFCHLGLGQSDKIQPLPPGGPQSPVDHYFMGELHLLLKAMPDDPLTRVLKARAKVLTGLDFDTPLRTAERYFRAAAARMPEHYWTYVGLGEMLETDERLDDAQLVYDTCVGLRPSYATGYALRAVAAVHHADHDKDSRSRLASMERGLADIREAVALDPVDPLVLMFQSTIHFDTYRPREAVEVAARFFDLWNFGRHASAWSLDFERKGLDEWADSLADLTENGWDDADTWSVLACARLAARRPVDAARAAERALEHHADHPRALTVRGALALAGNQPGPALADFEAALAAAPDSYHAADGRAKALEAQGRAAEALDGFDRALRAAALDWQRREAQSGRARALRRLDRPDEASRAEAVARDFVREPSPQADAEGRRAVTDPRPSADPGDVPVWERCILLAVRAEELLERKQNDEAIRLCDEAIRLDPKFARAFNDRAWGHSNKGDSRKVVEDYAEALRLRPGLWAYASRLGWALDRIGDYDRAVAVADEAIRRHPKIASAHNLRGVALRKLRRYAEAAASGDVAVELDPGSAVYLTNRAEARRFKGDLDQAIDDYRRAIAIDPKYALAHDGMGHALHSKGQYARAAAAFSEAIRLDPKDPIYHDCRAPSYLRSGELDKALADFDALVPVWPRHAPLFGKRGDALARLRRWREAAADFSRAVELDPSRGQDWYRLTLVRLRAGDAAGYRAACRSALDDEQSTLAFDSPPWASWCSAIAPGPAEEKSRALLLTEQDLPGGVNAADALLLGALRLRNGRPGEALPALVAAATRDPTRISALTPRGKPTFFFRRHAAPAWSDGDEACARLFLAMTYQGLGRDAEAREELAKARPRVVGLVEGDPGRPNWDQRLRLELLSAEAEATVLDPAFPVDPFAP